MRKAVGQSERDRPNNWRKRAEEARALAVGEPDEARRTKPFSIAAAYDELAKRSEPRCKR
jgi:hypothetical protein